MDKIKKENTLYLNRIKELEEEIARRDHLESQEKVMEAYQQQQAEFEQKKSETMETNV